MWAEFWNSLLSGDILTALFQLLLAVLSSIVSVILWPFSLLIKQFMPEFDAGLASIADYYVIAAQYMGWLVNALGIPGFVLSLLAAFYLFKFSVTFIAWGVKLMIQWKKAVWA